jgi:two-component system chemotaxis sensor kinase CheA
VTFRGERLPCLSLAEVLGIDHAVEQDRRTMVMLRLASGDLFALAVDQIHNSTDLVVKPLPREVMATGLYGGSTLLDNGLPILLLDIPQIAMNAGLVSDTRTSLVKRDRVLVEDNGNEGIRAILFTDLRGKKRAIRMELIQRIETIRAEAVDRDGKMEMAVVGDEILPLVGADGVKNGDGTLRLLRLSDGSAEIAYAVREVQDAITLDNELVEVKDDPLVEAKILIGGEPITLIDGHALFAQFGQAPRRRQQLSCHLPGGEWAQSILAPLLENAGYDIKTGDTDDVDIFITLDDVEGLEAKPGLPNVVRLRSLPDQHVSDEEKANSIYRYDRQALLAALRMVKRGEAA